MKKVIAFLMSACMLLPLASPVTAAENAVTEDVSTLGKYFKYSIDCLVELGLLRGTGGSLELDRTPTRAEAITMIVRLDGGEDEAKNCNYDHPFTDVPEWADGYIGYAYENGITKGISDTELGSDLPVTGQMYLTMVLRTLGYKDGGTYYGHSFTYDAPFELAEELGLLHAVYYRHYDSHDRPVFDINNEDHCIRERIQTVFNREYMSYITFNALTCLKIDEAPKVTLFEARHYEDTSLTDTRLYEIFRHKQVESNGDSAVIYAKPENEYELRTQPYALTVNGEKYTLTGRNILKITQNDGSYFFDYYCIPLFATLELLGIEYHFENNTVFASYESVSPNTKNVRASSGKTKDKSIYIVDSYKYNVNDTDIPTKLRIGGSIYDIANPSSQSIYKGSITISYRGALYIQMELLADMLGMNTDSVSSIYDDSFAAANEATTPYMADAPYLAYEELDRRIETTRPLFVEDLLEKIPSTYYEEYPGLREKPLTAMYYKDGKSTKIDINDERLIALVNFYSNSLYYGEFDWGPYTLQSDQDDVYNKYSERLEITFEPNNTIPQAKDDISLEKTCETIIVTNDSLFAVDQHLTYFKNGTAYPYTLYDGFFNCHGFVDWLSVFGFTDIEAPYFLTKDSHFYFSGGYAVFDDADWSRFTELIPDDHYVAYPGLNSCPIAATYNKNGESITLDINDPRLVRFINLCNNFMYHSISAHSNYYYDEEDIERMSSEKSITLELIYDSDSLYNKLWLDTQNEGTQFIRVYSKYGTGIIYYPIGQYYYLLEWLGF